MLLSSFIYFLVNCVVNFLFTFSFFGAQDLRTNLFFKEEGNDMIWEASGHVFSVQCSGNIVSTTTNKRMKQPGEYAQLNYKAPRRRIISKRVETKELFNLQNRRSSGYAFRTCRHSMKNSDQPMMNQAPNLVVLQSWSILEAQKSGFRSSSIKKDQFLSIANNAFI